MSELKTLTLNGETFDSFQDKTARAELGKIPAVTGATVGQTVKIAAVDDDGVPTAWENVDFPGGEEKMMELFATIPVEEEVSAIVIDLPETWDKLFITTLKDHTIAVDTQKVSAAATLDFVFDGVIYRSSQINTGTRQAIQLYVERHTWGLYCTLGVGQNNGGSFTGRTNGHAFVMKDAFGVSSPKQLRINFSTESTFLPGFYFYVYAR